MRDFIISFIAMYVIVYVMYLVSSIAIAFILLDASIISTRISYTTFRTIIVVALIMAIYAELNNWRNK